MTFGALIPAPNGNAFITPESIPIALYTVRSFDSHSENGMQRATGTISIPDSNQPVIPFLVATKPGSGQVALAANVRADNAIDIDGVNISNQPFTLTAFIFTIFPQPMPNPPWGMAIWDASGKMVLTHETRVLTDLTSYGTRGDANSSGTSVDTTVAGHWAIVPACSGVQIFLVSGGGPGGTQMAVPVGFSATFDGSSTRFNSAPASLPPGQFQGYWNGGGIITAIEVSKYL